MDSQQKVEFVRQKNTKYGEAVYLTGNIPALGEWNIKNAIKMRWSEGNNWRCEIYVHQPIEFEYKYFISSFEGVNKDHIKWDSGSNGKISLNSNLRQPHPHNEICVMSFNIKYDTLEDGPNIWVNRKKIVADIIRTKQADFVGLQEALFGQISDLQSMLPMYQWYGRGRNIGNDQGEAIPILYLHEIWEFIEGNTFWLSDTPEQEGSKTFGNTLPRICTWSRFTNKLTQSKVLIVNCHLDHENETARNKGAQLIKKKIETLNKIQENIFLLGDFNDDEYSECLNIAMNTGKKLIEPFLDQTRDNRGTFHGWSGLAQKKIDHILTSDTMICRKCEIIKEKIDSRYPSDHFPIIAEFIPQ